TRVESTTRVRIALPSRELEPLLIPQGSVAVDGVSLTVAALGDMSFEVMLIPYTLAATTLGRLRPGQATNVEADLIGKYLVRSLVDPQMRAEDLTRPGHVLPLRAMPGGVLRRAGHTEAAVDLARLAGSYPAGVICEVLDEDGGMARVPELQELALAHGLTMITIKDLIEYRIRKEKLVRRIATTKLPTDWGEFIAITYDTSVDSRVPLALVMGQVAG